ncbi:MAG: tetratricopeptide (TPR) repeat protein [Crocinitomix sp.]|jgi:tetratricopeptide (TPR) repeat protein
MIKILKGTKKAVINAFIEKQNQDGHWMYAPTNFPIGWFGIRLIMDQIDADKCKRVVSNNKAICSFAIPSLIKELNQKEQNERHLRKAKVYSHMNRPYEMFEAMADVLKELLHGEQRTIFMPDMAPLDFESIQTINTYLRLYADEAPDMVVGFATDLAPSWQDENGIIWERNPLVVQNMVSSFQVNGEMIDVFENENDTEQQELTTYSHLDFALHAHPEQECIALLESGIELSGEQTDSIIEVIENSFANYSFRGAIKLGLMLSNYEKKQATDKTNRLYTLIASAAHFLQFSHDGNPPFDAFLENTLKKALEEDKRPDIRCALLYRMAFTLAERKEDFAGGLPFADLAVKESTTLIETAPLMGIYVKSWAHMIRGFIYGFQSKLDAFNDDVTLAIKLVRSQMPQLEKETSTDGMSWKIEYDGGLFSHVNHQIFTAEELGLHDYTTKLFGQTETVMGHVHPINMFDPFHWVDFHRNKYQFKEALVAARRGIIDGKLYANGIYIYIYYFCAGDISYRIGENEDALNFLLDAEKIRPLYNDMFDGYPLNVFIADCQIVLGKLNSAEERLITELNRSNEADIRIKLASIYAIRGNEKIATKYMNDAIEIASGKETLMALIEVATAAGKVGQKLSNNDEALEAYEQALEFVAEGIESYDFMDAAVLTDLFLGLLELKGYDQSLIIKFLKLIPKAVDTPEAWPNFSRAIPFVDQFITQRDETSTEIARDELLAPFFKFIALRVDCKTQVESLQKLVIV